MNQLQCVKKDMEKIDKKKNTAHGCPKPGNMGNYKNIQHGISIRLALVSKLAVSY
jgi:hypothetical protein